MLFYVETLVLSTKGFTEYTFTPSVTHQQNHQGFSDYTQRHTDKFGKLCLSEKISLHKAQLVFTITPLFN
jgi:hypothetical protein